MNQYALLHFSLQKGERVYFVQLQPGAPFEDIQSVLDEFKEEFKKLQAALKAQQADSEKAAATKPEGT